MDREQLIADLTPFADLGNSVVKVGDGKEKINVSMFREGRKLKISIDVESGRLSCIWGALPTRSFSTFSAMLASSIFADLRLWADAQRDVLKKELPLANNLLPIYGRTHNGEPLETIEVVDQLFGSVDRSSGFTEVLVVDGPAGIGKTNLIQQLALRRAEAFKASSCKLVLHIKSRGRILSNIQDLMAFSLQTIRSKITYDQVPVLAKHGLVILAIDGFDELADPNGYEMAWAQLGELVTSIRGAGSLILAGRDTFIGRKRLLRDVPALKEEVDVVHGVTLEPPNPAQARAWLLKHNWSEAALAIPAIAVLLEEDSFALRPVFLRMLVEYITPKEMKGKHERYLTPMLVDMMIEREAGLFGEKVVAILSKEERENFVRSFLCEVARQMADSQAEALDASEIAWIGEICLGDRVPREVAALVRHRASAIAFLVNDERPGYRAFMHSYLLNYFLSLVSIDTLANDEIPKFIRRNILGSEFLSVFVDVSMETSVSQPKKFVKFLDRILSLPMSYVSADRGLRNVGAISIAALPGAQDRDLTLREYGVDEAIARGSFPKCKFVNVFVNQLDCRGADLSLVDWDGGAIGSMIADSTIRVSPTFPAPSKVILPGGEQLVGSEEVQAWLDRQGRDPTLIGDSVVSVSLRAKSIYKLLHRAARIRQYWLRDDEEDFMAAKIISDPEWDRLREMLLKHDYLRVENRQAAGRSSTFFHIKHKERILAESSCDADLKKLLDDL